MSSAEDGKLAELKLRFPGWVIWYVPRVVGPTVWCAQPKPLINTDSPEHLAGDILTVEREARFFSPSP